MNTWQKLKQNPKLWERYFVRERVIKAIRKFFDERGFHEVETPTLIAHPAAESYLDVFETTLLDRHRKPTKAYLSTSPEVALKKLLVAGIGNCYSLTKSFRNMETQSRLHNPEFTILEWYRIGATYTDIMKDCEELLLSIAQGSDLRKGQTPLLRYQGETIDLSPPWERISISKAFKKYAHVDFDEFFDFEKAKQIAERKGYKVGKNTTWEELFNQIFLNEIESHLGHKKPTILYDFPSAMGALAKKKSSDPRFAERFEFYIAGLELGDCYSELTDAKEQEERFERELRELRRLGKTVYDYDHDFIEALKVGLPECSGIAVGVDRLVMLFADTKDIADTLYFPGKESFRTSSDKYFE
ncbi:EF-P lysine aminoacylase GenX [Candidatus Gottesmanbacteria bacterium]|nr:EF-P lysine aminoacylase GenX [Candidatus Gottesmanbacteria bacterium]